MFVSGSFREAMRRRWKLYAALAATWIILGVLVSGSHARGGSAGFGLGMTAWEYARTQFGVICHYLRLAFWPSPLVLDYGTATVSEPAQIVPYAVVIVLLLAATAVAFWRRPRWGFLGVWFFAILAPSSSIVPLAGGDGGREADVPAPGRRDRSGGLRRLYPRSGGQQSPR